ncbi:hypothetical protein BGW80DRAFT_1247655 [Lactifluus volemus]|nr:hypothetical protein BGW80DRAFT_1247655 [Lactifluus volemus]
MHANKPYFFYIGFNGVTQFFCLYCIGPVGYIFTICNLDIQFPQGHETSILEDEEFLPLYHPIWYMPVKIRKNQGKQERLQARNGTSGNFIPNPVFSRKSQLLSASCMSDDVSAHKVATDLITATRLEPADGAPWRNFIANIQRGNYADIQAIETSHSIFNLGFGCTTSPLRGRPQCQEWFMWDENAYGVVLDITDAVKYT